MKHKKTWIKLIIVIILILIILYTFRNSAGDIITELSHTSLRVLTVIFASSTIYHFIEAWLLWPLCRRYNPDFKYRQAVYCAFYCSFYRLSTLGSGTGVAAVYYLGKHGIEYSQAIGLYMVQYVMHKLGIAIFSGIFFLLDWKFMAHHFARYGKLLLAAYGLTVLICVALILFVSAKWFHQLLLELVKHFNKDGRLDGIYMKLETNVQIMGQSTVQLIRDKKLIISMVFKNLLKFVFWYGIPFLILFDTGLLSLVNSLSTTSLSVMTAAVIPTPAGVGSTEFVMTSLLGVVVGVHRAGAVTVLYRIATFIFPFIVGAVLLVLSRFHRSKKNATPEKKVPVGKFE